MALSKAKVREILSKAGVDADHMQEALTEILDGNTASLDAIKEERDRYKEIAQRCENAEKELSMLKANGEKSPYKVKYEALVEERDALKKQFDDYKNSVAEKETLRKKKSAYRDLLKETGISEKRIDAVLRVSDFESLELGDDGKFTNAEKLAEDIRAEWGDFIATEKEEGAKVPNPPSGSSKQAPLTREEIVKIKDTTERQAAWQKYLDERKK